jgi:hypothetical protein
VPRIPKSPKVVPLVPEDLPVITEASVQYPIEDLRGLLSVFGDRKTVNVGTRTVTVAQVEEFLPKECFPIASRDELISKVIMAFERERFSVIEAIPVGR